MLDINDRWHAVADRATWTARGASFLTKLKATKAVWFPPKPVESGKKASGAAKRTANKTAKKTAGTAKKATTSTKKS